MRSIKDKPYMILLKPKQTAANALSELMLLGGWLSLEVTSAKVAAQGFVYVYNGVVKMDAEVGIKFSCVTTQTLRSYLLTPEINIESQRKIVEGIFGRKVMLTSKVTNGWFGTEFVLKQLTVCIGDNGYASFVRVSPSLPKPVQDIFSKRFYADYKNTQEFCEAVVQLRKNYTKASRYYLRSRKNYLKASGAYKKVKQKSKIANDVMTDKLEKRLATLQKYNRNVAHKQKQLDDWKKNLDNDLPF